MSTSWKDLGSKIQIANLGINEVKDEDSGEN